MNRVVSSAVVVAGLVVGLGGAMSWGDPPPDIVPSDNKLANTAGGSFVLENITSGSNNTGFGYAVLIDNEVGNNNTALGALALEHTTGSDNTASGAFALQGDQTGSGNTASGSSALGSNISGSNNTAIGFNALQSTNASYNTALGFQALYSSTGSRNIALGYQAGYNLSSGDKNIYLGSTGASTESNPMRLGRSQTRTFIAGIYGVAVGNGSPKPVYINSTGQLGTSTSVIVSSARYKRDIQTMGARSQGVYRLRPVTFRYKQDGQGVRQYGLIAKEVVKVYPELVTKGADGKVEGVEYQELIPMLLNEVQRQQQALSAQAQQMAELQAQNARLQAVVGQMQQRDEEQRAQNAALGVAQK
jgi:hypothetical protein